MNREETPQPQESEALKLVKALQATVAEQDK